MKFSFNSMKFNIFFLFAYKKYKCIHIIDCANCLIFLENNFLKLYYQKKEKD